MHLSAAMTRQRRATEMNRVCFIHPVLLSPCHVFLCFVSIDVRVKVQVFDSSDLSPLSRASVEVHGNQSLLLSSGAPLETGSDGMVVVSFPYQAGTLVIISASKRSYITHSVPWHASRIPCECLSDDDQLSCMCYSSL